MHTRKIDFSAVDKLCGPNREIMLYGFFTLLKESFTLAIDKIMMDEGFRVYNYNETPASKYCIIASDFGKKQCKRVITDLLIYNYEQMKLEKPIIPLIFCIGSEVKNHEVSLDYKWLLAAMRVNEITNAELRRCYKLYSESTGELRKVAEMTFNFFILKKNVNGDVPYRFEKVAPFWENPEFLAGWKVRTSDPNRRSQITKSKQTAPWRGQLKSFVATIDSAATLFNQGNTQVAQPEIPKNKPMTIIWSQGVS